MLVCPAAGIPAALFLSAISFCGRVSPCAARFACARVGVGVGAYCRILRMCRRQSGLQCNRHTNLCLYLRVKIWQRVCARVMCSCLRVCTGHDTSGRWRKFRSRGRRKMVDCVLAHSLRIACCRHRSADRLLSVSYRSTGEKNCHREGQEGQEGAETGSSVACHM